MRKSGRLIVVFAFALVLLGPATASANVASSSIQDSPTIHEADSLTSLGLYTEALFLLEKVLHESIVQNKPDLVIRALLKVGVNLELLGRYEESFQALLSALSLSETKKIPDFVAEINLNIGIVYFDMNQPEQAKTYYSKAYEAALSQNDTLGMIRALNNAGNVYLTLQNNGDSALIYFLPAYRLAEYVDYSGAMMAIGGNMAQLYMLQNEFEKADQLAVQLMKIDSLNPYLLLVRAMVLKNSNRFFEAADMCRYTLSLTDNPEFQMALLQELAQLSISMAEPQKAFEYLSKYSTLKDSLNSVDIAKHISSVEAQYQNEKKLRKIEQLEKDYLLKQKRVREMTFLLVGVVVIALIIVFYYRNKRIIAAQKLEIEARKRTEIENESEIRVARSYIDGEETERERLACEIHDGLGGMLTGIRLQLNGIISGNEVVAVDELNLVASRIYDASAELRQMSRNLFPQTLVEHGLNAAFGELVASLKRQFLSPELHFYFSGSEFRYDPLVEKQLFRTVQELVNNALKHAAAKRIGIELVTGPDRIWIAVSDDGTGFDKAAAVKGIGLRSVAERISSLNGKIDFASQLGEGTQITIELETERIEI